MTFELSSTAFADGEMIPVQYTCDGTDVSPPLDWANAPSGTVTFALICEDHDAPGGTFDHWVLWNIPQTSEGILEDVPPADHLPHDTKQGRNSFGQVGYNGPCPPSGPAHRYIFTVYALDIVIELAPGSIKRQLLKAMDGRILAEARLMGRYGR